MYRHSVCAATTQNELLLALLASKASVPKILHREGGGAAGRPFCNIRWIKLSDMTKQHLNGLWRRAVFSSDAEPVSAEAA